MKLRSAMLYSTSDDSGIWLADDMDGLCSMPDDMAESLDNLAPAT